VIHANRVWFAREFRRMLFPKALVILALVLASSARVMAGNLSDDREMWLRHYAAADGTSESLVLIGWTVGAVGALSYIITDNCDAPGTTTGTVMAAVRDVLRIIPDISPMSALLLAYGKLHPACRSSIQALLPPGPAGKARD
jgi:hypothetical protein